MVWCITSVWFDRFILAIIISNTIVLGLPDYSHVDKNPASAEYGNPVNYGSWRNTISFQANKAFTYVFTAEMACKIIAMGFVFGEGAYLKDGWNILDFVVVLTSLTAFFPSVPTLSIFRSFRVLCTLRNVSALPGLRKFISAFLKAFPEIGSVILLLMFVFIIFSVLGLSLFMGSVDTCCRLTPFPVTTDWNIGFNFTEYRCLDAPNVDFPSVDFPTQSSSPWHTPQKCYWPTDDLDQRPCTFPGQPGNHRCSQSESYSTWCGSNWDAYGNARFQGETTLGMYGDYYFSKGHLMTWGSFNSNMDFGYTTFNDIFRSFVTVFESVTLENWSWIMYMHQDANPPALPIVFFIVFAMLGAHLGLNLLLAILQETFLLSKEEDYLQTGSQLVSNHPSTEYFVHVICETRATVEQKKGFLYSIVSSRHFNNMITSIIILNTGILASDHYPSTTSFDTKCNAANFVCTLFFLLDMLLKMVALGIREYCSSRFNLFDGFIVVMSIIELCISPPSFISNRNKHGSSSRLSAFRMLRLLRLFKLAKQWKTMQKLIEKMTRALSDLSYLMVVLILFVYVVSLIGMEFFANRMRFDGFGFSTPLQDPNWSDGWVPRANYDTITWALFNTLNIMTAENWNNIMYDGWRATESIYSFIYFMFVVIFGQFLGMDMFLAILLTSFSRNEEEDESPAKANQIAPELSKISRRDTLQDLEAMVRTIVEDPAAARQQESSHSVFPLSAERTLFVFSSTNPIRLACAHIISLPYFDSLILLLIIISTVCLVIANPLMDPNSTFMQRLSTVDIGLTTCFCLEMVMKIIVRGLFFQPRAYLHSYWNILDFLVVFVSLSSLIPSNLNNSNIKALRSLRALRAFRPLRMVSRVPSLKKVVDTLFVAIPGVGDVMAIALFFLLVFGIICVNLFKGGMRNCALGATYTPGLLYDPVSNKPNAFGTLLTYPKSWNSLSEVEKTWFGPNSPLFNVSLFYPGNCSSAWPQAPCCTAWPEDPDAVPTSQQVCECWGSSWVVWWGYWTFDNIGEAMLTLYEASSTEGWVYLMLESIDQNGVGMQPIRDNKIAVMILYVVFIVLVHYLAMNLVVGVILENFQNQTTDEEFKVLTEQQQIFVKTQKIVGSLKPTRRHQMPGHTIRQFFFKIVENSIFDLCIVGCIFVNTLTMAMQHKTQSDAFTLFLSIADYFFCFVFTLEAIFKMIALGWRYFTEGWNRFDFVIVIATDVSLIINLVTSVSVGPIAQVVRSFRVGRIVRLLNGSSSLNLLIGTLMSTMIGLANIGALWLLILFIFAILGNQLYAKVALPVGYNTQLNYYYNFETFSNSLVTLLSFSGGEYWTGFSLALASKTPNCVANPPYDPQMCGFTASFFDTPQTGCAPMNGCGNVSAIFFMCFFYFIIVIVMLNLCVGVIIDEFTNQKPNGYITHSDFRSFGEKWSEFDPDATFFMDFTDLFRFLRTVAPPWRIDPDVNSDTFFLKAVSWRLKIYKGNKVHFYDVIHALAKDIMHQKLGRDLIPKRDLNFEDALNKILQTHQLDKIEPEKVNGVEIGVVENYKIHRIQSAWKEHHKATTSGIQKQTNKVTPEKAPTSTSHEELRKADFLLAPSNRYNPDENRTFSNSPSPGCESLSLICLS